MTERDGLRIGDAERTEAATELGEHYAQGRLTTEEHHERLDRIWEARTRADLAPIFADLPGSTYAARATQAAYPSARLPGVGSDAGSRRGTSPWAAGPPPHWADRGRAMARRGRGLPPVISVALAILVVLVVVTHLPFILLGLLVWAVVAHKVGRFRGHAGIDHRRF